MIHIIRSGERYHQNFGWLDARWHFSFADYHDPANVNFGPLRVFNDDIIAGGGGFDPHPHRDMEIISYIVEGGLRHQDSTGNDHITTRGGVQVMSAGKGIVHSEHNGSETEPVRLLQIWIMPRTKRLAPRWATRSFDDALAGGDWVAMVSDGSIEDTLTIDQAAAVYVARPAVGKVLTHAPRPGRRAYAFVITGKVTLNGEILNAGDQARVVDETALNFSAVEASELMLIDLPE
ncbi:MAG TPA: pirin family protein [Tepidisphaeraceae bacterium]|mgnify:FL=1|nr:pirin family protein [Tepidisphaeraceae bacterium]